MLKSNLARILPLKPFKVNITDLHVLFCKIILNTYIDYISSQTALFFFRIFIFQRAFILNQIVVIEHIVYFKCKMVTKKFMQLYTKCFLILSIQSDYCLYLKTIFDVIILFRLIKKIGNKCKPDWNCTLGAKLLN